MKGRKKAKGKEKSSRTNRERKEQNRCLRRGFLNSIFWVWGDDV